MHTKRGQLTAQERLRPATDAQPLHVPWQLETTRPGGLVSSVVHRCTGNVWEHATGDREGYMGTPGFPSARV